MSSEDFKITKEINSLTIRKTSLLSEIHAEQKRITFIQNNRTDRENERNDSLTLLKETKTLMQKIENEIANHQLHLNKDKIHLSSVTNNEQLISLEHTIKHAQEKIEDLENNGFELLDKIEELEIQIKDCETFLKGSAETLIEIQAEVDTFSNSHNKQIEVLDSRIKLLMESLPPIFQDRLTRLFERKIAISSFTRILGGSCEFCKFSLNKVDISNIEDKFQLKICQSCGRLFIPQQAAY